MPTDLGQVTVGVDMQIGPALALAAAATRMHDALFFDTAAVDALPERARYAWGDLQKALRGLGLSIGPFQDAAES